jgi:hypothetical protein
MISDTFLKCLFMALAVSSQAKPYLFTRGGASVQKVDVSKKTEPLLELALALQSRVQVGKDDSNEFASLIAKALKSLSTAQNALKGLDGAAHEAYQRFQKSSTAAEESDLTSVSGRARRVATRLTTTSEGLFAAELCELMEAKEDLQSYMNDNSTLADKTVLLQDLKVTMSKDLKVNILVLWEPSYCGGAGIEHGSMQDLIGESHNNRGRILVIVRDPVSENLKGVMDMLDATPLALQIQAGLVAREIASVQPILYRTAGRILKSLEPILLGDQFVNKTDIAFHFVGRSLAGGIASLAAIILDGSLPMPKLKEKKTYVESNSQIFPTLDGYGRGRTSATVLGPPPCLSANVKAFFVRSIIYGDDIVCRTSQGSILRLCERVERALSKGVIGRRVGWMSDVVTLTVRGRNLNQGISFRLFTLNYFYL